MEWSSLTKKLRADVETIDTIIVIGKIDTWQACIGKLITANVIYKKEYMCLHLFNVDLHPEWKSGIQFVANSLEISVVFHNRWVNLLMAKRYVIDQLKTSILAIDESNDEELEVNDL
jgi:hypothetical protein